MWGRLTGSLVRDTNGTPKFAVGMIENITDRKQAEEALRESEERYRSVVESVSDSVSIIDGQGNFLLVNQRAAQI